MDVAGRYVPGEIRPFLNGARMWCDAPRLPPRRHTELPVPRQSQSWSSPIPMATVVCWLSVVRGQCCCTAGHRACGSPCEFWEVFSFSPTVRCWGNHVSLWRTPGTAGKGKFISDRLPTSPKRGLGPPSLPRAGTAPVLGHPGPPGAT